MRSPLRRKRRIPALCFADKFVAPIPLRRSDGCSSFALKVALRVFPEQARNGLRVGLGHNY
jgi:hypothetical protein